MLSVDSGLDPLLKRPFSLHRWLGRDFQILYRTVGKLTYILKDKKPGDTVEIVGPLGTGFPVTKSKTKKILAAGGLGMAPLLALAESMKGQKTILFLGAKTKKDLLCINELMSLGIKPVVSTDDGSLGCKGLITEKVNDFLRRYASPVTDYCLYACGPRPMLKELSLLAKNFNLKGYIALEENMACGIGACMGCVVNTKKGFKPVCKEGPVFSIDEIVW